MHYYYILMRKKSLNCYKIGYASWHTQMDAIIRHKKWKTDSLQDIKQTSRTQANKIISYL